MIQIKLKYVTVTPRGRLYTSSSGYLVILIARLLMDNAPLFIRPEKFYRY